MRTAAVTFEQVYKRFGNVEALAGLSFSVREGGKIALLGQNGAGKSTAISLMLGLRAPSEGSVMVFGREAGPLRRAGEIGAMLQEAGLPPGIQTKELLSFYRGLYPAPLPFDEIVARARIEEFIAKRVEHLSGGQRRRVLFALAIAGNPRLLFLDEPTSALDAESRRAFWREIDAFAAQDRTVLFTTHHLDEADAHAEHVLVIQRGRLLVEGSPADLKRVAGQRTIRLTATPDVAARIRDLLRDTAVTVQDRQVSIAGADAETVVKTLLAAGISLSDLEVGTGTLEDALLQLEGAND